MTKKRFVLISLPVIFVLLAFLFQDDLKRDNSKVGKNQPSQVSGISVPGSAPSFKESQLKTTQDASTPADRTNRITQSFTIPSTIIIGSDSENNIPGISPEDQNYLVRLKNRSLLPGTAGIVFDDEKKYIYLQFNALPGLAERAILAQMGVTLESYVGSNAYQALVSRDTFYNLVTLPFVQGVAEIIPEDKILPSLAAGQIASHALIGTDRVALHINLFSRAGYQEIKDLVARLGGEVFGDGFSCPQAVEAVLPKDKVRLLAEHNSVSYVQEKEPPRVPVNTNAALLSRVNLVRETVPYNLSGSGITVGIWDEGSAESSHRDLTGRLTNRESGNVSYHTTHVSGTIGGTGTGSASARGMAPAVRMLVYDFNGSMVSEQDSAAGSDGVRLTSNSWGYAGSSLGGHWGEYNSYSSDWDRMLERRDLLMLKAAGNDRDDGYGTPYGSEHYFLMDYVSTAKNPLVVAAVTDAGNITGFSNFGPTLDGRLKPEISANGDGVYSTVPGNTYGSMSGTSMATPVVTGTLALISEWYRQKSGALPGAALLKALLINTAADKGLPGPDYIYGYGLLDAKAAADAVLDHYANGLNKYFVTESVSPGQIRSYQFMVGSQSEIKTTLAWLDAAGNPSAFKALIDDLDLALISPSGQTFYPYHGRKDAPHQAALADGPNRLDNVEQVLVRSPASGLWTLRVSGFAVASGTRAFALASNVDLGFSFLNKITGTVVHGNGLAGVAVRIQGSAKTAATAADGSFTLSDLVPGTYTLSFEKTGYTFLPPSVAVVLGDYHVDLGTVQACRPGSTLRTWEGTSVPIADQQPSGVTVTCNFGISLTVTAVRTFVEVAHALPSDLTFTLRSPHGTAVTLTSGQAGLSTWFGGATPAGDNLARLNGENSEGDWTLTLSDGKAGDTGSLRDWKLEIEGTASPSPDHDAPDTFLYGPSGKVSTSDVAFSWSSNDPAAAFSWYLQGRDSSYGAYATTVSASYAGLAPGNYTLWVKSRDQAGNVDPTPASRAVTVTTAGSAPHTTILSGPPATLSVNHPTETVTFTFTADEDALFSWYLIGQETGYGSFTSATLATYTVGAGSYEFRVRALNRRRNLEATPATRAFTLTVDFTPPTTVSDLQLSPVDDFPSGKLRLAWTAPRDDQNAGRAAAYDLRLASFPITAANWSSASAVAGTGTPQAAGTRETLLLDSLSPNTIYYAALRTRDALDNWSAISNLAVRATWPRDDVPPGRIADMTVTPCVQPLAKAALAAISASREIAENLAPSLKDGRLETFWSNGGLAILSPDSLTLDLGSVSVLDLLRAYPREGFELLFPRALIVAVSSDRVTWQETAWDPDCAPSRGRWLSWPLGGRSARYVRITISEQNPFGAKYYANLSELEVWKRLVPSGTSVTLGWTAPGDNGYAGRAASYEIRYHTATITDATWNAATVLDTAALLPGAAGSRESFTATALPAGNLFFAGRARDRSGNLSPLSNLASLAASGHDLVPPAAVSDLAASLPLAGAIAAAVPTGVSASSFLPTHGAAQIHDRDRSTGWATGGSLAPSDLLTIDLGRAMKIRSFRALPAEGFLDNFPRDFRLEASPDGIAWQEIKSVSGYPTASVTWQEWSWITPVPGRYLRWNITGAGSSAGIRYVNVAEVEVRAATGDYLNSVVLTWTAPGSSGTVGQASRYQIRFSSSPIADANWSTATDLESAALLPGAAGTTETLSVPGLTAGQTYYFALKTADARPNWSPLSNVVSYRVPQTQVEAGAMAAALAAGATMAASSSPGPPGTLADDPGAPGPGSPAPTEGTAPLGFTGLTLAPFSPSREEAIPDDALKLEGRELWRGTALTLPLHPARCVSRWDLEYEEGADPPSQAPWALEKKIAEVGWQPCPEAKRSRQGQQETWILPGDEALTGVRLVLLPKLTAENGPPPAPRRHRLCERIPFRYRTGLHLTAVSDEIHPRLGGAMALDGNPDTAWSSEAHGTPDQSFLTVDTGVVQPLERLRLLPRAHYARLFPTRLAVETSGDGQGWKRAAMLELSEGRAGEWLEVSWEALEGRFLRIRPLAGPAFENGRYYFQLAELECFAAGAAAPRLDFRVDQVPGTYHEKYASANLSDGQADTSWSSLPLEKPSAGSVVLSLDRVRVLGELRMLPRPHFPELFPSHLTVAASEDGSVWQSAGALQDFDPRGGGWANCPLREGTRARFLRLTADRMLPLAENDRYYWQIAEIELIGQRTASNALTAEYSREEGSSGVFSLLLESRGSTPAPRAIRETYGLVPGNSPARLFLILDALKPATSYRATLSPTGTGKEGTLSATGETR